MKTPEELAEEYMDQDKVACAAINHDAEDLVEAAFLAGYQAAAPQWISVKDRLPEDGDDLSIMLVWRSIEHDYDTVRWRYQQGWDCVIQDKATITHWMPLPKPPSND